MVTALENEIFSLEQFPERGSIRRVGAYANQDYRQLFVKNYTIIYRVHNDKQEVHIVTVRYAPSQFLQHKQKGSAANQSCGTAFFLLF